MTATIIETGKTVEVEDFDDGFYCNLIDGELYLDSELTIK